MSTLSADLMTLLPELILAVGAMVLLLIGAVRGPDATAFHGAFVVDGFVRFIKAAILWSSAACVLMADRFFADQKESRFELPVLMLLATCGMSLMVSAQSFLSLYMGLELQSLALYVLAAVRYRAMIPLMYVLMLVDLLGHKVIKLFKPITYVGVSAADFVNPTIIALSVIGLCLALTGKGYTLGRTAA